MSVAPGRCAGAAASCGCGIRALSQQAGRVGVCSRRLYFLYSMRCKQEFDEKLMYCVHSFPVICDPSKKSYNDRTA
jgi:hypothetical protein